VGLYKNIYALSIFSIIATFGLTRVRARCPKR
jgi:hypothetical protein